MNSCWNILRRILESEKMELCICLVVTAMCSAIGMQELTPELMRAVPDSQAVMAASAVSVLTGAVSAEDMNEDDAARLLALKSRPVNINTATRSRLMESGLFSPYQVASLIDYRSRQGDILSEAELAAVDGFGPDMAALLMPFVSLESFVLPGKSSAGPGLIRNSLVIKGGTRLQGNTEDGKGDLSSEYSCGMKYRFSVQDRLEAAVTLSCPSGVAVFPPEAISFYLAYYGKGTVGKVIAGDFNTRFGQGLAMWSGFSMSGVPSQGAFSKRMSGISPYWSYSGDGSHRGVAADFCLGRCLLSVFASFPGLREYMQGDDDSSVSFLPGMNLAWVGMNGQVSVTFYAASGAFPGMNHDAPPGTVPLPGNFFRECMLSADAGFSIRGTEIFAEAALDAMSFSAAAIAGCRFRPCGGLGLAVGLRYYPGDYESGYSGAIRSGSKCTNEYGVSVSGVFSAGEYVRLEGKSGFGSSVCRHQGDFSLDFSRSPEPKRGVDGPSSQIKGILSYRWQICGQVGLHFKLTERIRTYGEHFKTDARLDFRYGSGPFSATVRMNVLKCVGTGLLTYAEAGYKDKAFHTYIRGGLFRADDWEDRIYAYERDAPGNFSVPAFYGRGFWSSLTAGVRFARWVRCYFRASYTGYPWQSPLHAKKKPGKAELKVQAVFNL